MMGYVEDGVGDEEEGVVCGGGGLGWEG